MSTPCSTAVVGGGLLSLRPSVKELPLGYQLYTVHELLALQDTGDRWIVKNMVPWPGRTLVHGYGGTYKSSVFFDLAVAIASDGQLLETFPAQRSGPVLVLSSEGDVFANRDRLLGHIRPRDLDPSTIKLFFGQQALLIDTPEGRNQLIALIEETKPVMVILDPLVSFFSGDENSVREMKLFLHQGLDPLIDKYRIACVVIHHSRKDGEVRGSTAIQGWADSMLRFDVAKGVALPGLPEPVDVVTVECKKQRNGKEGKLFSVVPFIDELTGMTTWGLYNDVQAKGVARVYLKSLLVKMLKQSPAPLTRTDLRSVIKMPPEQIDEALSDLIAVGLIEPARLQRSTSADGSRTRSVEGYITRQAPFTVDSVKALLGRNRVSSEDLYLLPGVVMESNFRVPAGISRGIDIPADR